jgi:GNAT superfamily N-acetyltransferase
VTEPLVIRRATDADLDVLVPLVSEFYLVDRHEFDPAVVRAALGPLLAGDEHGVVLLVGRPEPVGYAVVTWGYSLEAGGRECVLDEIYVRERGGGLGTALIAAAMDAARAGGALRMALETERPNSRARGFYQRHGFAVDDSIWLARWLTPPPPAG